MNWLFDHFEIVALIILGLGSMIKRALDSKAEKMSVPPAAEEEDWTPVPPPLPRSRRAGRSWELPQDSQQPPPLRQRNNVNRPTPDPIEQNDGEPLLLRQQKLQERMEKVRQAKAIARNQSIQAHRGESRAPKRGDPKEAAGDAGPLTLVATLRQRRGLRQAVVLREILGPPVGLR